MVTNHGIDKLSSDITVDNEKLIKLSNDVSDLQLSSVASHEMIDKKSKKLKKYLVKKNKKTWNIMRKQNMKIKD